MNKLLFKKLNSEYTIQRKIDIIVERHFNNYFLNQDLSDIKETDEAVRPLVKINQDLYDLISYDQKSKAKKLMWVYERKDVQDFCQEFKQKYDRNTFKSVREAEDLAAKIYAQNCSEYQAGKATVTSENGVRKVKKRCIYEEESAIETFEEYSEEQISRYKLIGNFSAAIFTTLGNLLAKNDSNLENCAKIKADKNKTLRADRSANDLIAKKRCSDYSDDSETQTENALISKKQRITSDDDDRAADTWFMMNEADDQPLIRRKLMEKFSANIYPKIGLLMAMDETELENYIKINKHSKSMNFALQNYDTHVTNESLRTCCITSLFHELIYDKY